MISTPRAHGGRCTTADLRAIKNLLVFENNLSFEITDFKDKNFKKIYLVSNKNDNRSIKLSEKLLKFKSQLIEDQEKRLKDQSIDCEIINISEITNIESCCGLYPTIGENLDFLNSNNLGIHFYSNSQLSRTSHRITGSRETTAFAVAE